ncbi:hypothetical protein FKW77_000219 [Venturia effusa]|uniref:Uncharacterized protein n=1 Tax=Venturia effusa TaxID=50376 RepID=A0A517LGB4_9PEZI|nr:hypothetical protein FKW77_000219 [Venturia effusa]
MSLLQNEDFVLYQLRTAYLSHIKDGVGERLITVNASVLNDPAFRAAGWQPNASDIKRTYSPPIPTAITSEYFQAPRPVGVRGADFGDDDEDEGGMVTGGGGSNDTVGPDMRTRRRRRKEQLEEDDSSDLSDESEEDADGRPVQQIKFSKMPLRSRAGSSPLRSGNLTDGPALLVTSPSRPDDSRLRRGSLGAVEPMRSKGRPRKDTTTSSELSSDNELDASYFQRKAINPRRAARASALLSERIQEDEREDNDDMGLVLALGSVEEGAESDSSMSSEFAGTADTGSILGDTDPLTSLPTKLPGVPLADTPHASSLRRKPQPSALTTLQALPPPRPISMVAPVSALTLALKAKNKAPESPFDRFATVSGKGDPNPLYIKVYVPSSAKPSEPFEILLRKMTDGGGPVTVAEAVGFALFRYGEEKLEPAIPLSKMNVNRWEFRMVEDGEVEEDFPALKRTKNMNDFTSNNNRPPRARSREKPWDEFGLVEASDASFKENEILTPEYSKQAAEALASAQETVSTQTAALAPPQAVPTLVSSPTPSYGRHPITGPSFSASTLRTESKQLLDQPAAPTPTATPRTGAPKSITIHFMSDEFLRRTTVIEVTTDTYIAEVFDQACKRLGVDKASYVLKVSGSSTVAPSDRTVEALGVRTDLDLQRRRFIGDGTLGLSGSPGSSSPNAPLLIQPGGQPKRGKKGTSNAPYASLSALAAHASTYKRYNVTRKQPMSFSSTSSRVLALDGEYFHIMPSSGEHNLPGARLFEQPGKVTTVHFSSVVGSKVSSRHPKAFKINIFKERETKRYDFEATTAAEAKEIVAEVKKGMNKFHDAL